MFDQSQNPSACRWISVIFLQGQEAHDVLSLIDRSGPFSAIEHLQHWDFGDETTDAALTNGYVYDRIPAGSTDQTIENDGSPYALTYSAPFGYVSLLRRYPSDPALEITQLTRATRAKSARSLRPADPWAVDRGQPTSRKGQAVSR
jgi:hypothetical protein